VEGARTRGSGLSNRGGGARASAAVVLFSLAVVVLGGLLTLPSPAAGYTLRGPILIDGEANFTAGNGVTGGTGTPSDPYLIEGWEIAATTMAGIHIRDTTVSFIVRDNFVHSGGSSFDGVYFERVRNGVADANIVSGNQLGFRVDVSTNVTLSSNNMSSNRGGIYLAESSDVFIVANVISSHVWHGISVIESTLVTIAANQISDSGSGISLSRSTHATLEANRLTSDGVLLDGDRAHFSSHAISPDNLVNGKPLLYHSNCSGLSVVSVLVGELIVANCTGVRVANLDIANTDVGILMGFVENVTILENRVSFNDIGVLAESSVRVRIEDNNVHDNEYGLVLRNLTGATLRTNDVSYNWRGTEFYASREAALYDNTYSWNVDAAMILGSVSYEVTLIANNVSNNGNGISYGGFSQNVSLLANIVSSNLGWGISVGSTANVSITGNRIAANGDYGIIMGYGTNATIANNVLASNPVGIHLYGSPILGPPGVLVRHNDILANTAQAFDDQGLSNVWDDGYPSGGNFWSDYAGVDNCSGPNQNVCPDPDGIGDTPYVIDGDSRDRYPLVTPRPTRAPVVTVLSPNGGEDWTGGSVHQVMWMASDETDIALTVLIELSINGFTFPYLLLSGSRPTGTTAFSWALPAVDTTAARVRICAFDSDGLSGCDVTDTAFTIDSSRPVLLVTQPADGAEGIDPSASITLTFSEPMNTMATQDAVSISPTVPGTMTFSWDSERRMMAVEFVGPLEQNTYYVVSIGCGTLDDSDPGISLEGCPGATRVQFRTKILVAPPVASARTVQSASVGFPVTFDGSGSTGEITTWTWTIKDHAGAMVATFNGAVVTYTFGEPGTYAITLRVEDAFGRMDEYSFNVAVQAVGRDGGSAWVLAAITAMLIASALFVSSEPGRVALMTTTVGRIYGGRPKDEKDSEFRGAILYYVRVHPGDTYTDVKRNLELNDGVVTYHLARLEKDGLIRSEIRGARKRYYPAEMRVPMENGGELHDIQQRILRVVTASPGMPVSALAEQLGVSTQLALYHLRQLSRTARVDLERPGLRLRAYPGRAEK